MDSTTFCRKGSDLIEVDYLYEPSIDLKPQRHTRQLILAWMVTFI